jgi:hypothetical protein
MACEAVPGHVLQLCKAAILNDLVYAKLENPIFAGSACLCICKATKASIYPCNVDWAGVEPIDGASFPKLTLTSG